MTLKLKSAAEQQKFRTDMEQIDRSVVTIKC